MGVTGLWKLIESSGKPVPLETLENKVLAIDISIWLHQVTKGFQDAKGSTLPNAHLLGLFHRLCKLLFYRIKPIFVFDGSVPALKRQTIAKRAQSKNKLLNEAERLQNLLLATLAKEKVVQQALGSTAVDILAKSPVKPAVVNKSRPDIDEMFILPPMVEEEEEAATPGPSTTLSPAKLNLHSIDVDSSNFKTLPADVRHEILTDIKETRKQSSWGRLHELPAHSDSFSSFQMQRLLKRRKVQVCLESAQKEMGGQSLSVQDLERMLTEEGIVQAEASAKRIHSDDSTRFLMVTSIKQAMEKALQSEQAKSERSSSANDLGPEFNEDLKRAVQMSLNPEAGVDENEDQEIFLSAKQKSNLTEAAKEMARAYMMEHAGMSKEDVDAILRDEEDAEMSISLDETLLALIEKNEMKEAIKESLKKENNKSESTVTVIESDLKNKINLVLENVKADSIDVSASEKKSLEIVIDPSVKITEEEDLFADVFQGGGVMEDTVTVVEDIGDSSDEEEEVTTKANGDDDFSGTSNIPEMSAQESVIDLDEDDSEEEANSDNVSPKNESCNSSEAEIIAETNDSSSSSSSQKVTAIDSLNVIESKAHVDPKTILKSLERQKAEIVNLTLDDVEIKRDSNVTDIIEIPSSPEGKTEELEELITPSKKRKMLTDYFETSPRKTPKKATPGKDEVLEAVPYVKSPFFVKRTPRKSGRSSEKKVGESPVQVPGSSKAAKSLFGKVDDEEQEPQKLKTNEELIKEASDLLRSQKSAVELEGMAEELRRQEQDLEQERNKQSRMGVTVTERMSLECQDMLRLFGIPFIVAPMEAEAQCAFLNSAEITHGTITDDSDVWLFGGATVYKNFFDNKKHVMEFRMATIEQLFHVDRKKLIQLALLVGSDYTTGITGIGAVTGMEILAQFPTTPASSEEGVSEYQAMVSGLRRFKEWWAVSHQGGKSTASGQAKGVLRNKLKNISIGESFPSQAVVEAYLYPRVDENRAEFSWGTLDVETIREFARKNFGWTRTRTDELLLPVVKKWEEKRVQTSIRNYFNTDGMSPGKGRVAQMSKRMKKAVEKMDPNKKDGDEEGVAKAKKPRMKRLGKVKTEEDVKGDSDCQVVEEKTENKGKVAQMRKQAMEVLDINKPSTSKRSTRAVRIPDADQVIPQRGRTKQLEEESKRKAAEIFQKNKEGKKMKD